MLQAKQRTICGRRAEPAADYVELAFLISNESHTLTALPARLLTSSQSKRVLQCQMSLPVEPLMRSLTNVNLMPITHHEAKDKLSGHRQKAFHCLLFAKSADAELLNTGADLLLELEAPKTVEHGELNPGLAT